MKKYYPYLIDIVLFTFIFLLICLSLSVAPFGPKTLLTIDLGQQYIDFFALFKEAFLHDHSQFIYSFQKGIAGETIGLWTYYLLSPFNLLFLGFKETDFPIAVTLITYLKLLACSISFLYFTRQKFNLSLAYQLSFALFYAYSSYNIVYLLNIMWLDGMILLPLIAWGLERLVLNHDGKLYYLSLGLMLMINYYIAYMICLFLIGYALYIIFGRTGKLSLKDFGQRFIHFVGSSILAAGTAAIILIPTVNSILQSKGQHFQAQFDWQTQMSLADSVAKLFIGAFNFEEIKTGAPNLYIGSLPLLALLLFFSQRTIHWRKKVSASLFIGFYLLSFIYNPLDLMWHGGQFPIWYTYRFAFTLTFFGLVLALTSLEQIHHQQTFSPLVLNLLFYSLYSMYYYFNLSHYSYLSSAKILTTLIIFSSFTLLVYLNPSKKTAIIYPLILLTCLDIYGNASLILSEFSHLDQAKFQDYVQVLDRSVRGLRSGTHDFYRIDKDFMRTKNEAFFGQYNGLDHFSSTLEAKTSKLYGYLGLADGSGFATYTNPNLFLDDFFNIRYHILTRPDYLKTDHPGQYVIHQEASNFDKEAYPVIDQQDRYLIRENTSRLGLAMEVSARIVEDLTPFKDHQPVENQEYLLQLLNFDQLAPHFFEQVPLAEPSYDNLVVVSKGDGDYYTYHKNRADQVGTINYQISLPTTDPYYLSLPSQYDNDAVSLNIAGQGLKYYRPYKTRQLLNIAYQNKHPNIELAIKLHKIPFKANLPRLYRLNLEQYQRLIKQRQANILQIDQFKHDQIQGHVHIQQDQAYLLFTIPYDPAWKISVDGQEVKSQAVLNHTLLAIPIEQGDHQISMIYRPKALFFGIMISIASLLISVIYLYMTRTKKGCK